MYHIVVRMSIKNRSIMIYFYMRAAGKPTRLKPKPNPAPWRALLLIEGATKSRMENIAAAVKPSSTTLSMDRGFSGRMEATIPTTKPSIKYLTIRVNIS